MAGKKYRLKLVENPGEVNICKRCWFLHTECPRTSGGIAKCTQTPKLGYWKLVEVEDA